MSVTLFGALGSAALLGITHAIEPDHVAGISSLTSRYADSRLSALAGACFSLGHVVLVVVWLVVGYLLLGQTSYPAVFDAIGTLGVVVLLSLLGLTTMISGLRSIWYAHVHEHNGEVHTYSHAHFPWWNTDHADGGPEDVAVHGHDHGLHSYLKTGVVGALFTLSPPLSMILFASTLYPTYGGRVVVLAVIAYAAGIVGTMSLIGAGVGAFFSHVSLSSRAGGVTRVAAGAFVSGLAVLLFLGV